MPSYQYEGELSHLLDKTMKETLIAGDGKPSPEEPKPLPKPPVKLWEYLLLKYEAL